MFGCFFCSIRKVYQYFNGKNLYYDIISVLVRLYECERHIGNNAHRLLPHISHLSQSRMLYTIAAILVILWILGLVSSVTLGGFIHVLLVIAIIVILVRLIRGENPLA